MHVTQKTSGAITSEKNLFFYLYKMKIVGNHVVNKHKASHLFFDSTAAEDKE